MGINSNSSTEATAQVLVPVTKTFTKFYCATSVLAASGTTTFVVRINGTDTSTTCTLSTSQTSNNVTGTYAITAGNLITVGVSNNSATTTVRAFWGLAP